MYTPNTTTISLHKRTAEKNFPVFSCTIDNYQCHTSDCPYEVSHLLVKSDCNVNWNRINSEFLRELNSIERERAYKELTVNTDYWNKMAEQWGFDLDRVQHWSGNSTNDWLQDDIDHYTKLCQKPLGFILPKMNCEIFFSCDDHLMSNLSSSFYNGGYLNNHFIKKVRTNEWVHFKDSYYCVDPSELNLNDSRILFRMNVENYMTVLRECRFIIFGKLNNITYFGESLGKSGMCTLCDCTAHKELKSRDYINREQVNAMGFRYCRCGHRHIHHYFDDDWDDFIEDPNKECTLKWPINYYNDRGIIEKVVRN